MRVPLSLCVLTLFGATQLTAQQIFRSPEAVDGIGIRASHILSRDDGLGAIPSAVVNIDGYFTLAPKTALEVGIPLSYYKAPSGSADPSASQAGNPYIGIDRQLGSRVQLKVGVRPGIFGVDDAQFSAAALGIYADFDHLEEWAGKNTALRGMVEFGGVPQTGEFVTAMAGITFLLANGNEAFADYGVRLGYQFTSVTASLQLTGRLRIDNGLDSFAESDVNQIAFVIDGSHGTVRPFFAVRTFLDDDIRSAGLRAIVSLGLTISTH